jgi:hypothetical protein
MTEDKYVIARASNRQEIKTTVEFYVDGDIETATSVDVSNGGMSFETAEPVKVRMRLKVGDEYKEYYSRLVWARKNPSGSMSYGFEFITDDDECLF